MYTYQGRALCHLKVACVEKRYHGAFDRIESVNKVCFEMSASEDVVLTQAWEVGL